MATHDYVIDNSTGSNVRSDINNVLQAILTNNSSSSAPSTTAAYMWWADTTTGTLKIRNSSNNDWVELLQLDGTLTLEDGSASTPALAFRDDLNTGIFSSAANHVNFTTNGVERIDIGTDDIVVNNGGADLDFRIEGDTDANLFKVDAGNDRVGIGTSSPLNKFHIQGGGLHITTATVPSIRLVAADNSNGSATNRAFFGIATASNNFMNGSASNDTCVVYSQGGKLLIGTGTAAKAALDSNGNAAIGTTTVPTGFKLAVDGDLSLGETSGTDNTFIDQKQNGMLEIINSGRDDNAGAIRINRMNNISGDTTYFRDVNIYNGKGTTVMYVDGSAGAVGIGTTSPDDLLELKSTVAEKRLLMTKADSGTANQAGMTMHFQNFGPAATARNDGTIIGRIRFSASQPTSGGLQDAGSIECRADTQQTGNSTRSRLSFLTSASATATERMRIDRDGRVLIGSGAFATPKATTGGLDVSANNLSIVFGGDSNAGTDTTARTNNTLKDQRIAAVHYANAEEPVGVVRVLSQAAANDVYFCGGSSLFNAATSIFFYTAANNTTSTGSQRMQIDSAGRVSIGTTANAAQFNVYANAGARVPIDINDTSNTSTLTHRIRFMTGGTEVGRVRCTNSATQYDTSASDRTLKKNFEDWTENTLDLFKNINPQKFNFIQEEDGTPKSKGFIAQEITDSFPEAYSKGEDNKYWFNPSGMVVYLMKAIQELEAKVAALEAG